MKFQSDLEEIRSCILNSKPENGVGLLNGECGKGLYAFCETLISKEESGNFDTYLENSLAYCLGGLNSGSLKAPLSFAEGLPGICFLLNLLKGCDRLDESSLESLNSLENLLYDTLITDQRNLYKKIGYDYFY